HADVALRYLRIFHTRRSSDLYREEAFSRLRGMFSVIIWDVEEEMLYGVRDTFGIKPLFYYEHDEGVFFASEKKSITTHLEQEEVTLESLQYNVSYQYVLDPYMMTKGIKKLEPGHYFKKKPGSPMEFTRYFHATFNPVIMDKANWIKDIQDVLRDSVNVHMRSDVPVGSFLSGGIDSTIIVALA